MSTTENYILKIIKEGITSELNDLAKKSILHHQIGKFKKGAIIGMSAGLALAIAYISALTIYYKNKLQSLNKEMENSDDFLTRRQLQIEIIKYENEYRYIKSTKGRFKLVAKFVGMGVSIGMIPGIIGVTPVLIKYSADKAELFIKWLRDNGFFDMR